MSKIRVEFLGRAFRRSCFAMMLAVVGSLLASNTAFASHSPEHEGSHGGKGQGIGHNPPTIEDQSLLVDENEPSGSLVGQVVATRSNNKDTLRFEIIAGNEAGHLQIEELTGIVTTTNNILDFETIPELTLEVQVTDKFSLMDTALVTVLVGDLNEAPAIKDVSFVVSEAAPTGTIVGSVPATDEDSGDTLTFVITAGNRENAFTIDPVSGELETAVSPLDFVTAASYDLTVEVSDSGGLSNSAVVTISAAEAVFPPFISDSSELNGTNGFTIRGITENEPIGPDVAFPGDLNGDGIGDIVVSAPLTTVNGITAAGAVYVVFGTEANIPPGFPVEFDLASLDGTNGFAVEGTIANGQMGVSIGGAGDVNNDGLTDLVIGAPGSFDTRAYVVFGATQFPAQISTAELDGSNGFRLNGGGETDWLGSSVTAAGDINGDGIDDVAVGAQMATFGGFTNSGKVYLIYGKDIASPFSADIDLSDLSAWDGVLFHGRLQNQIGMSLGPAGDINGDGVADFIIGAELADSPAAFSGGRAFVVFGNSGGFPDTFDLADLDGSNGFAIDGIEIGGRLGASVGGGRDVNGDGLSDIVVGASFTDVEGKTNVGTAYTIFGIDPINDPPFPATFDLSSLDGSNGFKIVGEGEFGHFGGSVNSRSDIDADGLYDIILLEIANNIPLPFPITSTLDATTPELVPSRVVLIAGREHQFPAVIELST
ncbi:MAG: cadherin domain-containing protein, partial [Planctomycetota bacterium]